MSLLHYCLDPDARSAPMQMALDEVMMKNAGHAFLRQYQWAMPTISIGYFTPSAELQPLAGECEVVRRFTGGGLVDHRGDWTFSLTLPSALLREFGLATREWYCRIHCAVRDALSNSGVYLQTGSSSRQTGPCFVAPVEFDGMLDGRKIFGGAIRKSRHGLLYQGSLQGHAASDDLLISIGEKLNLGELVALNPEKVVLLEAAGLAASRYEKPEWLNRF